MRYFVRLVVILAAMTIVAWPASPTVSEAAEVDVIPRFLDLHCVGCHDKATQSGGLDLSSLDRDLDDPATFATWVKVHDRVRDGEMPPRDEVQPPKAATARLLRALDPRLHEADAARQRREGPAPVRRLNRDEYQNTLRDLLGVESDYRSMVPEDGSALGFDKLGSALSISPEHSESYMAVAEAALNEVVVTGPAPVSSKRRIPQRFANFGGGNTPFRARFAHLFADAPDAIVRYTAFVDGILGFRANQPGTYRFLVRAHAWESPGPMRARIRAGFPGDNGGGALSLIGYYDFPSEGAEVEVVARLQAGDTLRVAPYAYPRRLFMPRDQASAMRQKGPGLAIEWVDVEGPLYPSWPPPGHQRLFGALDFARAGPADAERVLREFLPRAFRRPVTEDEVRHYLRIHDEGASSGDFRTGIRRALKAALCSPHFLFLRPAAGPQDEHALAARLSYFLWNTMPDDAIFALAEQGTLHQPDELRRQVDRMLKDPKSSAFRESFTGQWLDLRKINATSPDATLYPEFDDLLEYSMTRETRLFFDAVLDRDLSVVNFVKSDFAMLNDRLAQLYEIPGVEGVDFREVKLPPDSVRGGVLTQASVMKVTANGTTTSPVLRGAWVTNRLLGKPVPPPPASVPAIEPDVRGATTIRELLSQHRSDNSCATCHARIDPPGFALERFDVIGGRRDRYRIELASAADRRLVKVPEKRAQVFVGLGPSVDSGGQLPDGRPFRDFEEFRELLAADKDQLARALAGQLLTYATGSPPRYADRAAVDGIVGQVRTRDYGFKALMQAIVQSPAFLPQ